MLILSLLAALVTLSVMKWFTLLIVQSQWMATVRVIFEELQLYTGSAPLETTVEPRFPRLLDYLDYFLCSIFFVNISIMAFGHGLMKIPRNCQKMKI